MKIACLNFFKEQRECFECISLPVWGRYRCRFRKTGQWGSRFEIWADFVKLVY